MAQYKYNYGKTILTNSEISQKTVITLNYYAMYQVARAIVFHTYRNDIDSHERLAEEIGELFCEECNFMIKYPFPKITLNPEDIAEFVKKSFIEEFGEENLINVELETYPNEYSIDIIVHRKDKAVSLFVNELRRLFIDNGLSVLLAARQQKN